METKTQNYNPGFPLLQGKPSLQGLGVNEITPEAASLPSLCSLTEAIPHAAWVVNASGCLIYANRRWASYTGITAEGPVLEMWARSLDGNDAERIRNLWASNWLAQKDFEAECRLFRESDRTFRWHQLRSAAIEGANGTVVAWLTTWTDIDSIKEPERNLVLNEQRFHLLVEAIPQMVWSATPDGNVEYVNRKFCDFTGLRSEEMLYTGWLVALHPDDREKDIDLWRNSLSTGEPFENENRIRAANGEYLWHLCRGVPVFNENGQIFRWIGTSTNIDSHRRLEDAYRQSRERYDILLRATNDVVWDWNIQTGEVIWNEALGSKFGFPSEGSNSYLWWLEKIHPDERLRIKNSVETFILSCDSLWEESYRFLRQDGTYADIYDRGFLILDSNQCPHRMIGAMVDISRLKKTEQALEARAQDLARSNADLQQFADVVSHDLREPLRMVSSFLQLLKRHAIERLEQSDLEFIGFALDGATRMRALMDDLLEYARVGSRGRPFQPVRLDEVLDLVLKDFLEQLDVTKAVVHRKPLPTVLSDRNQMRLLFQHLLGNALKFQSETNPEVWIEVEERPDEWLFSIRDRGIGFDPEHRERIFVIFQRLGATRELEGTGVGLAICKRILDRHGGKIWAESTPGAGATFYFTLPRKRPDAALN